MKPANKVIKGKEEVTASDMEESEGDISEEELPASVNSGSQTVSIEVEEGGQTNVVVQSGLKRSRFSFNDLEFLPKLKRTKKNSNWMSL